MAAETDTEETGGDEETSRIVSINSLADTVQSLVDKVDSLISGAHGAAQKHETAKLDRPSTAADKAAGISEEMRQAIEEHERQKQHDETLKSLTDFKAKAEAVLEKAPREYRKVEQRMGWVRKEDQ